MLSNLIICTTILQSFIAKKIIEKEKLNKESVEIFFYSNIDNTVTQSYYEELRGYSKKSTYLHVNKKIYLYLNFLRKLFARKQYDTVYLASIDSNLIYFILSMIKFKRLITFDDGTANIVQSSIYYVPVKNKKNCIRNCIYFVLGNRYSLKRIKKAIFKHYTIYPDMKNITSSVELLNIFDLSVGQIVSKQLKRHCTVILGTAFIDIVSSESAKHKVVALLQKMIDENLYSNTIYIPHPRDSTVFHNVTIDDRVLLAEEKIIKLLEKYETISVYGFCSSTQFSFLSLKRVNNFYLLSNLYNERLMESFELANKCGMAPKILGSKLKGNLD